MDFSFLREICKCFYENKDYILKEVFIWRKIRLENLEELYDHPNDNTSYLENLLNEKMWK